MAQNIYDQNEFFNEYIQLSRQKIGLDGAPEWPSLRSFIPDVRDKKFLDLGCGFGWYSRWALENGAKEVKGIDISQNMLDKANTFPHNAAITYARADLESLQLPANEYEIVFSALTLHYLKNLPSLITQISQALKPGGSFVFSTEHPIYTAPRKPEWILDSEGASVWPLDGYLEEGIRVRRWFTDGVQTYHRTLATYLNLLLDAGLQLSAIEEWSPSVELIKDKPEWADQRKKPWFLFIRATKPISR